MYFHVSRGIIEAFITFSRIDGIYLKVISLVQRPWITYWRGGKFIVITERFVLGTVGSLERPLVDRFVVGHQRLGIELDYFSLTDRSRSYVLHFGTQDIWQTIALFPQLEFVASR